MIIPFEPVRYIRTVLSVLLLSVLAAFVIIKLFFVESRQVMSGSMADTLHHGDYILGWRVDFREKVSPGILHYKDIIVFYPPGKQEPLIKRIIGLPGDTVALTPQGLFVNGNCLQEEYLKQPGQNYTETQVFQIAQGELFVLGDNRSTSWDSEEFGTIPLTSVKEKVFLRYHPLSRFGWLP